MKEKILVTGGGGYIGSLLVRILLNKGYKVRVLDKLTYGLSPLSEIINNPNLEIIIEDIRKNQVLKNILKNIDHIIHLAAIVGDPACSIQADVAVETNFIATNNLARLAKTNSINKFIFTSTCSVYGSSNSKLVDEESPTNPLSLYSETKLNAEKQLLSSTDKYFSPTILRLATAYGLSPRMRFDIVINSLTKKALFDGQISIFGGNQWRPFTHVKETANAIYQILKARSSKTSHKIYNLGFTTENYQIQKIGKLIKKLIPNTKVNTVSRILDNRSYKVSFNKLEDNFKLKNKKNVNNGISEIIQSLKSGQIKNPNDPIYYNY